MTEKSVGNKRKWSFFLFALRPVLVPAAVLGTELMLWTNSQTGGYRSLEWWQLYGASCCILFCLLMTAIAFFNPQKGDTLRAAIGATTPFLVSGLGGALVGAVTNDLSFLTANWVAYTIVFSFIGQSMVSIWHLCMSLPTSGFGASFGADDAITTAVFISSSGGCDSSNNGTCE